MTSLLSVLLLSTVLILTTVYFIPFLGHRLGRTLGWYIRRKTSDRRAHLLTRAASDEEEHAEQLRHPKAAVEDEDWETIESYAAGSAKNGGKAEEDWEGIIGFFHPFCNAGGGGERVLWAAIRATQKRWPKALCIVYTGDHDVDKTQILTRVEHRFNIHLHSPRITFLYLSTRHYVLSSTYPHFTLLGQSLGSLVLAWDAFSLLVPDIYIDTMGYAFTIALSKLLYPEVPTGAYVHYPTISTDMLGSLDPNAATENQGLNAGAGVGLKGMVKRQYWQLFARLYSWVGGSADVVMTNSSWTQGHIRTLWGPTRTHAGKPYDVEVVFPPVAVEELEAKIPVSPQTESKREQAILYIAQFRPEKNHNLILRAFSQFSTSSSAAAKNAKLVLVGSVRNSEDATRVYDLRLLAHELKVKEKVEFVCDASWQEILNWLSRASVGVNGMWNEHFGIGVVEYQAAGLISVVHDSGGPKADIVTKVDGKPTGYLATTADEFAAAFETALTLGKDEKLAFRLRAQQSAKRFTDEEFAKRWTIQMERLIDLQKQNGKYLKRR